MRSKKVAANPPKKIQIDTPSTSQAKVIFQKKLLKNKIQLRKR